MTLKYFSSFAAVKDEKYFNYSSQCKLNKKGFIFCEIHCYFCPHIFGVYYFSLSQCVQVYSGNGHQRHQQVAHKQSFMRHLSVSPVPITGINLQSPQTELTSWTLILDVNLRLSSISSLWTISEYCLIDSLSSGAWKRMRNGKPSSVSSSAFSNVISRTSGEHLSTAHAFSSS